MYMLISTDPKLCFGSVIFYYIVVSDKYTPCCPVTNKVSWALTYSVGLD